MRNLKTFIMLLVVAAALAHCAKHTGAKELPSTQSLTYGDSIFYVADGSQDITVLPAGTYTGHFTAYPDGIELDETTGAINVSKSETGLRYRISFVAAGTTDTISTIILLSGINYRDNIYSLEANDTLAPPVYNAQLGKSIPPASLFDDGDGCKSLGIEVNPVNGNIDLGSIIRNGVLGSSPSNGAQKEVDLLYRIGDASNKAQNKVRVKFYYFDSPQDITPDLVQQMKDRKGMFIGVPGSAPFFQLNIPATNGTVVAANSILAAAKPRPPCIFIVRRTSKQ